MTDGPAAPLGGGPATRVGQGLDVHAFAAPGTRTLRLGGLDLPGEPALSGHSDGDAVLHALTDAVLGAAGMADIGELVGVDLPATRDGDSAAFLRHAVAEVAAAGWRVGNADVTVVGERPRIGPHRAAMRERIAALMGVDPDAVNVKATTTDHLGFLGRGEGLAALAVVLLHRPSPPG